MAVDDRCRLCSENLRVRNTLTNTKKIFDAATGTTTPRGERSERSVYERLAALGLTLSRHPSRSARVCRSCFRQLGRVEAGFAVFRRWVEAERRAGEPEPPPPPPPPVTPSTSTSMVVPALITRHSALAAPPRPTERRAPSAGEPEPPPPAPPSTSTSTSTSTAVGKQSPQQHGVLLKMEEDEDDVGSASKPTTTSTSTAGHQQQHGSGSGSGSEKRTREPSPAPETPGSAHKKVCPEPPAPASAPAPVPVRMLVPPATQTPTPTTTRKLSKETTRMPERRSLTKVSSGPGSGSMQD